MESIKIKYKKVSKFRPIGRFDLQTEQKSWWLCYVTDILIDCYPLTATQVSENRASLDGVPPAFESFFVIKWGNYEGKQINIFR